MATRTADLAEEYWDGALRASPRLATTLGDHRFDDRLEDPSAAGRAREAERLAGLLRRASDAEPRDDEERLTLAVLRFQLESERDLLACELDEWTLDPYEGPVAALLELEEHEGRWPAVAPFLDAHRENLVRGAGRGRFATRRAMLVVREQVEAVLSKPLGE